MEILMLGAKFKQKIKMFSGHTKSTDTNLSQNFSDNQPFVHFVRISYGDSGNKGINVKVRELISL